MLSAPGRLCTDLDYIQTLCEERYARGKPDRMRQKEENYAQHCDLRLPFFPRTLLVPSAVSAEKVRGKPPKLYYGPRYRTYISPMKLEEDGDISWVCSELAGTCLVYQYRLGEEETHTHGFEGVLREAYDHAEEFSIPEGYRAQYSAQELNFLEKVAERGRRDRREWKG